MNRIPMLIGAAMVFFLLGCASATKLYPGPQRPPEETATLKMATNGAIMVLNGRKIDGRHYELLPGNYDLTFRYILRQDEVFDGHEDTGYRDTLVCVTKVELEGGRDYELSRSKVRIPMKRTGRRQTAGEGRRGSLLAPIYLNATDLEGEAVSNDLVECHQFMKEKDYLELYGG